MCRHEGFSNLRRDLGNYMTEAQQMAAATHEDSAAANGCAEMTQAETDGNTNWS
jgi:hypothetical protein